MDSQVQTSFIPKKSLDIAASRSGSPVGLLFLLALLVFITSLVAAGASFLYTRYLTGDIANKSHSLALAEGAYDPGSIQDLLRLDSRLTQSKTLLANHVAVSGIFAFLSTQTLAQVSFSSFDYELDATGAATLKMNGTADSFSTVALQSDQFGASKLLKNVVFSGITVETNGTVAFSVSATLDPSILSYSNSLGASVPITPPSQPADTTTPSAPATTTVPTQ